MNVYAMLEHAAATWPDRPAVVDEAGVTTFAQVWAEAEALRVELVAQGVSDRMGVGLVVRNGRRFVVGAFALLGAGATVMPLFHQTRRLELLSQIGHLPLHGVLDDRLREELLSPPGVALSAGWGVRFTRLGTRADVPFVPHVPDAAFVRYTSGTTGQAKGVVLSHRAVWERTEAAQRALGFGATDTVAWMLPMAYHFVATIAAYVRYGVTVAVCPDLHADGLVDVAVATKATFLYASPLHLRLMAAEASGRMLPDLKWVVSTSTALPRDVATAFEARFHLPVRQLYGIIECGLPTGDMGPDQPEPASVGRPMPGYEVAILDEALRPVAPGQSGQLAVRGQGLFDGYLDPPSRTEDVLQAGWFLTGDLAVVDASGRVTVCGRRKSMINVAGHKVFPEEVEAVLDAEPGVLKSRAFGVPHPSFGEVVRAEVVAAPDATLDASALVRACQQRLSAHKVPQQVVVVADIAMTGSGKVRRAS